MNSNLRVHITPVGYDFLRVTEPLIKMHADKVYLVTFGEDDSASKFFSQIKNELSKKYRHIQIVEVFIDIWNLFECIGKFCEIILAEKSNHVYINVSTGTKITAIAGMLSCMLWDANPYYAPVSYPHPKKIQDLPTEQVSDVDILPVYDITKPKSELMKILNLLNKNGGRMRKSKMIELLEDVKILRKTDDKGNEFQGPAKHSQLRAFLDPMERQWNYVRIEAQGRRSEVIITEQGITALKIFGCANDNIENLTL